MECGKRGHFKCTTEKESWKMILEMTTKENLDEFSVVFESEEDNPSYDR